MPIELSELLHNLKDRAWDVNPVYQIDENEAEKIIKALESIEVRRKGSWISSKRIGFGKWEEREVKLNDIGEVSDSCYCSECGEWLAGSDEYSCIGKYCPNCGARMVVKE